MSNLMSMARGRFKSKGRKSKSKNMARRKTRRKSKRRSSSSGSGSGKVLGIRIPVIGKLFGNPTVKKALMGAGAVSLALSVAALVNNASVNKALNNKLVRIGLATAAGDIAGGVIQVVKESPQILSKANGNGAAQTSLVPTAGGGVA